MAKLMVNGIVPNKMRSAFLTAQLMLNEDSIHIGIKMVDGSYEGKFIGNDSITGTWTQRGNQFPLNFSQNSGDAETQISELLFILVKKKLKLTSAVGSKLYRNIIIKK